MRVVLDTNVLVSALLMDSSRPAQLISHWRQGRFTLLTAVPQLDELMRVTRYPKLRARLKPALAGRLVNDLRQIAVLVKTLPPVDASPDPYDNYLLSIASGGQADYLVTGDKPHLLALGGYAGTNIASVRDFILLARLSP
ncbi:MAG: putative toxin-antitoxin system toxin component, PIN family [Thiocapsa sp.]|uniref:putative toxin-antitoxin system toxin component, PIN family n=1 Tax=Thiocapsa sp. TaxID=2024551 RepID=UPI001BCE7590|nr:putative toxin-antitoxin system toxin component, PIN family [Thiocapsa sp.]QVL47952.1 MAG: putative toxin-antitoxin system toxin component, PIN family [Thiocapsa sp.]